MTLNKIKIGFSRKDLDSEQVDKLLDKKLIEKRGRTNAVFYILSKDYYEFTDEKAKYYNFYELDDTQVLSSILQYLSKEGTAKMKELVNLFEGRLSRKQVRVRVERFVENRMLDKEGDGSATFYIIGENYIKQMEVLSQAIDIGMKEIGKKKKRD